MTFLKKLFSGATPGAAVPQIAVPTLVIFKRKKWVVYKGTVGIVKEILNATECVFSLVSPASGHTVEDMVIPIGECRIARYEEIKDILAARNKEPFTPEQGAALGYF